MVIFNNIIQFYSQTSRTWTYWDAEIENMQRLFIILYSYNTARQKESFSFLIFIYIYLIRANVEDMSYIKYVSYLIKRPTFQLEKVYEKNWNWICDSKIFIEQNCVPILVKWTDKLKRWIWMKGSSIFNGALRPQDLKAKIC